MAVNVRKGIRWRDIQGRIPRRGFNWRETEREREREATESHRQLSGRAWLPKGTHPVGGHGAAGGSAPASTAVLPDLLRPGL